jgi:hypothetical protein
MAVLYTTLANMNYAEQEKINYPPAKSVWNGSRTYGSDFSSSSSQDGDMTVKVANAEKNTLQGEGRDDSSTTATALLALSEARAEGTHVFLGNTCPPPNKTNLRKERARNIANYKNKNVTVSASGQSIAGNEPQGQDPFSGNKLHVEATDPKAEAEAELHKEDEAKSAGDKVDMTLASGKETNIDDAEV